MLALSNLIAPGFVDLHLDLKQGAHSFYRLSGGRGSGKSCFISLEIILGMMRDAQNGILSSALVLRRYKQALHDSVFAQLVWAIEKLGVQDYWRQTVSPLRLTYLPTGQSILFRGADNVKKEKSIAVSRGYIRYLWFEELDEFESEEKIRSVQQGVLRGGERFTVFYSFNPPRSLRHWVNDPAVWQRPGLLQQHSTYRELPESWLGEQFLADAELLRQRRPELWRHEYLGLPGGGGCEVFANLEARTLDEAEIRRFDRVYNGLDWGFWPDPWAFNRVHFDAARRTLYLFFELTRRREGNEQTARALLRAGLTARDRITADSAEPKSVQDYRRAGLCCRAARKGPGSVAYSLKWLQSLERIVIDPARCPDSWREFSGYEFSDDGGYPDADNHHIDAVRYALEPVWRRGAPGL